MSYHLVRGDDARVTGTFADRAIANAALRKAAPGTALCTPAGVALSWSPGTPKGRMEALGKRLVAAFAGEPLSAPDPAAERTEALQALAREKLAARAKPGVELGPPRVGLRKRRVPVPADTWPAPADLSPTPPAPAPAPEPAREEAPVSNETKSAATCTHPNGCTQPAGPVGTRTRPEWATWCITHRRIEAKARWNAAHPERGRVRAAAAPAKARATQRATAPAPSAVDLVVRSLRVIDALGGLEKAEAFAALFEGAR